MDPCFIILFGSYAKKNVHPNSDLDLAFINNDIFMIAQALADQLKIEVDLINLEMVATVFKAQIFATGEVLYSVDDNLLDVYRMTTFSMYARLNEERQEILENIIESGSVYGK